MDKVLIMFMAGALATTPTTPDPQAARQKHTLNMHGNKMVKKHKPRKKYIGKSYIDKSNRTRKFAAVGATPKECMAKNLYFEAGGHSSENLAAVGYVVLTRVKSKQWPSSVCKVVGEQRKNKRGGWTAMFSWTNDGKSDVPRNTSIYNKCLVVAAKVLSGSIKNITKGANHYHNIYVKPKWANSKKLVAFAGGHKFYRL
jgi:spore germination cell wall hydrolase CwlJ-like protein